MSTTDEAYGDRDGYRDEYAHGEDYDYDLYRDSWGVPHLRAPDPLRLSYAQGRTTALDRARQLEIERLRAEGASAALLGPESVPWDRFARQSRLADTARRCYGALDPETAAWVRAYVAGVNDGLASGAARDPRFVHAPEPWEPWVPPAIWVSTHILFAGFATKLWRERAARALDDEAATLFATDATVFAAFRAATVRRFAADPVFAGLADAPAGPEVFHPWLYLLPRVGYALEGLLATPLLPALDRAGHVRAALEDTAAPGAPDTPWSEVHRLAPRSAVPDAGAEWPGLGGDHDCVNATSTVPGFTDLTARASAARYVWDLARREDSLWVVPLGADGVTGSPHHRDQLPLWARCELVPVVTDWACLTKESA